MRTLNTFAAVLTALLLLAACRPSGNEHAKGDDDAIEQTDSTANNQYDRYWNDLARLLAGKKPLPGSVLGPIETSAAADSHRKFFAEIWPGVERERLAPIRKFAESELGATRASQKNMLYPFSGADFLTMHTLFPNAENYTMYGLEPEGRTPDLRGIPENRWPANFQNLQYTLGTMLHLSFFRTIDMQRQFNSAELNGATPVILSFLSRAGNEALDVRRIMVDRKSEIVYLRSDGIPRQTPKDTTVTGMEIKFRKSKNAPVQTLRFFCFDAQNAVMQHQQHLLKYFSRLKPTSAYFKSASYLMHWDTYSMIRENILEVSDVILQDDTGIALRKFDHSKWDFQLYGQYQVPIYEFTGQYQADLAALYQSAGNVKPISFGLGYHKNTGVTNLMIARKKKGANAAAPTPADTTQKQPEGKVKGKI